MSLPFLKKLKKVITEKTYCNGTLPLPTNAAFLYYGKGDAARRLNLITASDESLSTLADACDRATFGLGDKDVLDETYRRAGKLDVEHFASTFDLVESSLLKIVRSELLEGEDDFKKSVRAELYKLNVYDKGAFFKAHKDTPRGETMFGSLVVVFPTRHEGGKLLLRHGGQEWAFDASTEIFQQTSPAIGYVAFYSDVEHEVIPITSGHRVTLTYNLHFVPREDRVDEAPPMIAPAPSNEAAFRSILSQALADPAFLPKGGKLGFGLNHQYPFARNVNNMDYRGMERYRYFETENNANVARDLQTTIDSLKGSDAMIFRVCKSLSLQGKLRAVYKVWSEYDDEDEDDYEDDDDAEKKDQDDDEIVSDDDADWVDEDDDEKDGTQETGYTYYMLDRPVDFGTVDCELGYCLKEEGAEATYTPGDPKSRVKNVVHWVTKITPFNDVASHYIAMGNEAQLKTKYGSICLIVEVGKHGRRGTIPLES